MHLTPLSPHAYSAAEAAEDGAHAHQEDVAVSSSPLHVSLLHRDWFVVNATPAQLLVRRLRQDELRAAWIGLSSRGAFVAPLVSGAPTSGEYTVKNKPCHWCCPCVWVLFLGCMLACNGRDSCEAS
jgi:hypothetical protein